MPGMLPELIVRKPVHLVTEPWSDDLVFSDGAVRERPATRDVTVLGRGLYILPGMIDAHAHLMTSPRLGESGYTESWRLSPGQRRRRIREHLATQGRAGVAAVRDMGAASGGVVEVARRRRGSARPFLQAAGRFIAPPRRYPAGVAHEVRGATSLASTALEEASRGGGWVKLIGDYLDRDDPERDPAGEWTSEEIAAAVAAAHAAGARVAIHAMTAKIAQGAIEAGVDTVEHGCGLEEADLQHMATLGIAWTPTLAAFVHLLDRIRAGEPLLPAAFMERSVERVRWLVSRAEAAGVVMLCGTDGILRHGDVAREVLALADAGLNHLAALRAATVDGWTFLGLGEPLQDGSPADALVFERNPLDDPRLLLRPIYVIRAGRLFPQRPDR